MPRGLRQSRPISSDPSLRSACTTMSASADATGVRQAAETGTRAARTILDHCNADTATGSEDLAATA